MAIVQNGATQLRSPVEPHYRQVIIVLYNHALVNTYYIALATACLSIIGALGIENKSIKTKKTETAGDEEQFGTE